MFFSALLLCASRRESSSSRLCGIFLKPLVFQTASKHPSTRAKLIPSSSKWKQSAWDKVTERSRKSAAENQTGAGWEFNTLKVNEGALLELGVHSSDCTQSFMLLVALSQIYCWLMHKMKQPGLFWYVNSLLWINFVPQTRSLYEVTPQKTFLNSTPVQESFSVSDSSGAARSEDRSGFNLLNFW